MSICQNAVLEGSVLEKQVSGIFMDEGIFWLQSYPMCIMMPTDITLQIHKRLVGLALDLQAFGTEKEPLGEVLVEGDAYTQVVYRLLETLATRKNKSP